MTDRQTDRQTVQACTRHYHDMVNSFFIANHKQRTGAMQLRTSSEARAKMTSSHQWSSIIGSLSCNRTGGQHLLTSRGSGGLCLVVALLPNRLQLDMQIEGRLCQSNYLSVGLWDWNVFFDWYNSFNRNFTTERPLKTTTRDFYGTRKFARQSP